MINQIGKIFALALCLLLALSSMSKENGGEIGPQKRALIIEISNYAEVTGWNSINAENDIILLEETFLNLGLENSFYAKRVI